MQSQAPTPRIRNTPRFRLPVAVLLLAAAPVPADEAARARGDLIIGSRAILRKYCGECHGAGSGRGTINVTDHAALVAKEAGPVPFVAPGNDTGSQVIQLIEDGSMPPGGRPRPTPAELATLKAWVKASALPFPAAFDERTTLEAMLADLNDRPNDAPHLRYFSFAHLVRDDGPPPDLKAHQAALEEALQGCGIRNPPQPVDVTATLFRFDTRQAGWDNRELFHRRKDGKDEVYPLSPYDLLLLDYPHGSALTANNPLAAKFRGYFEQARLARPITHLRGDWVAEQLKKGAPLAADLVSLTELAAGRDAPTPSRPFGGVNPVPRAAKPAAVNPVLPLAAWYSGDCQAEPPPFPLKAEVVVEKKAVTSAAAGTPFQLRVASDRGLNFVLLRVRADGSIEIQPTGRNGVLRAGETVLTPKEGEDFTAAGEPGDTEYFVLLASQALIPEPIVVRSRHTAAADRFPVSRFLFDPQAKLDSARVVRKVIPITVTKK